MRSLSFIILFFAVFSMKGFADEIPALPSEKTAIILIEFQKTWTERGIFFNMVKEEYESRHVLSNTLSLLDSAREKDVRIIHAPVVIDRQNREHFRKVVFLPKFLGRFTQGTWKAEFTEGVFQVGDPVVTGRTAFDATIDSNLEELLVQGGYTNLLFCGFTTDHCVAETMETLIGKGYNCYLISDCTAAGNARKQERIEKNYLSFNSRTIIEQLIP